MTDEEKLQDYLRRNAQKEEKAEKVTDSKPAVQKQIRSSSKETPMSWYQGQVWATFFWISVFYLTFFCFAPLAVLNSQWGLETDRALTIGSIAGLIGIGINLIVNLYRLYRYSTWMKGGYYTLSGWNEFFEKRTKDFWNARNYTNIRISFNLSEKATDLHREAIKAFTGKIIKKWNKRYQDKDYEWEGEAPKDLETNGLTIYGDISQKQIMSIVKILVQFIPLSRMLKANLDAVVLSSTSKERLHSVREEKDDGYDQARSWQDRHTSND